MANDSELLQDVMDRLNCGDTPTRILATRQSLMAVLEALLKQYREMDERLGETDRRHCVGW